MITICRRMLFSMAALMGVMGLIAGNSFASTQQSQFGQCGSAVHSGAQLVGAWKNMHVLADKDTRNIVAASGWSSMDGSLGDFVSQRGKEFQLAKAADVPDFGCQPGNMFPVGTRHYGAGEWVIGIVPAQYAPSQVSGHPCKGCKRQVVNVHSVGRGSCANGFPKYVAVVMYVHPKAAVSGVKAKTATKKPKKTAKPKKPPTPPAKTVVCNLNGVPQYTQPSGYVIDASGNCVQQSNNCSAGQVWNGNQCVNTTVICGNNGSNDGGNCNTNTPPPPDQCPNITGVQVAIPQGDTLDSSGNCVPIPPPPPAHFTQVSCVGFEEITGGASFIVQCTVSDDNGAAITLTANSNDGNSRVSGINCYSQGGTPSCQGNGTFEFRVSGINNGSTVLSSSITVTASANGVDKTFKSDPFPVDQAVGGF